jgi:hypothetical protein
MVPTQSKLATTFLSFGKRLRDLTPVSTTVTTTFGKSYGPYTLSVISQLLNYPTNFN